MKSRDIPWSGKGHDYSQSHIDAVVDAMKNADPLTQGKYLSEFEAKFKKYLGVNHAFAVANCTNALDLVALLSELKIGDEIIIPAHTFCATAIPFARTGAKIIWADIDPNTLVVSKETIKPLINKNTKMIVVVHLYGLMCNMEEIMSLAGEFNILVVEDCAQAIGADLNGKKAGSFGDFSCFSFHGAKNMSTLGEGGMLVIQSNEHAKLIPGLRHNGVRSFDDSGREYWKPAMSNVDSDINGIWPYNFCLSEVQCAAGSALLENIEEMTIKRIKRAEKFIKELKDFTELIFQKTPEGFRHVYHLLVARYNGSKYGKNNDDFIRMMYTCYNIKTIVQFYPLYRYPLFYKNGFGKANCPNTDKFFDNMVSFPFHLWMTDDDFNYMINSTIKCLKELRK